MNFKNLLKFSTLVFLFTIVLGSSSFGQTTYYVDVQNGLDGYNGLQPTVGAAPNGPKQTITNAIAAASDGDVIMVAFANGNLYNENINYVVAAAPNKRLTFGSYGGGTPKVVSFTLNSTNALAPDNFVTFSGPFLFTDALTLTDGQIKGATNITVGGLAPAATVTRNSATPAFGSVDGQINFATGALVDFVYLGGSNATMGGEIVPATNTATMRNLNTAAGTITLNSSKTMNGVLTTGGVLAIGAANTLTVNGASLAHAVGGNVTGGTLAFAMTGAVTVTGNFNLPNVTAGKTTAGLAILTLTTNTTIGSIAASGNASVTAATATTIGAVSNSGAGAVSLMTLGAGAKTVASLTNSSTGSITVDPLAATNLSITGNIAQSGSGFISVAPTAGAGTVAVGGTVTNNPTLTLSIATVNAASNRGVIIFGDKPVTITGLLTVAPVYTGNATRNSAGAATVWTNTGEVRFLSTTVGSTTTLTGGVLINTTQSGLASVDAGGAAAAATVSNNGGVVFAAAVNDNILIPGGVSISTNWSAIATTTNANNGDFNSVTRAAGSFGTIASRVGTINVTSSASNGANGNFLAGVAGGFNGTNVTTSGGTGGFIVFGNETVNLSGNVTNSRTSAANHLDFGTAVLGGLNVVIGGNLVSNGSSNTRFVYFDGGAGNETFTVTGTVNISGGTVAVNAAAALNGTGTFQFGGLTISGGILDLTGAGTSIMDVIINGPAKFYGGTVDIQGAAPPATNMAVTPVVLVAADRLLQLGGLQNEFSTAAGSTTFTTTNTTLLVQPTAVVAAQTMVANLTATVWPGRMIVKNPTFLQPAVTFSGGNIRALGGIAFDLSQVRIDNVTLFVGGLLAPNIGTGDFYNHAGYVTSGQGFVSMNNNAAGGTFGGAGTFENFEVDCAVSVTAAAGTGAFTKLFNLTQGNVLASNNVNFNNTTDFPTIVRNAGTFAVAPTFTSMVNVIYIGLDKTTANELPAAANKLNNLTVATTNDGLAPLIAGRGAVTCAVATTVNGTLNVYDNQALIISGVNLTMNGAVINLNNTGILANDGAANTLVLNRATGTTISGAGWLPDITVAVNSVGNKIDGARGLVTSYLGTDYSFGGAGGAADFDPTAAQANGSLTFGAGTAALEVVFGAGALNGSNIFNITTADAGNTLTVSSNMTSAGNMAHTAGAIAIGSGFTWTYRGLAPAVTGGAFIQGPGTLAFRVGGTLFSAVGSTVTIAAPVVVNLGAAATTFTVDPASAGHLILSNDFTVTQGTVVLGDNVAGRNLTLTGKNFTMTANSSFAAHNGAGAYILGTLILNASTANAPMLWSHTGTPTLGNVTVTNDVTLGGTGAGLVIYRTFTHNGGTLNFSDRNITIDGVTADIDPGAPVLAAAGTFNRTAATAAYSATTGYLIISTVTFNQGTGFSIPNLRFGSTSAAVSPTFGTAANATVTTRLYVDIATANTITHTVGGSPRLYVNDGALVIWNEGKFDVVPVYGAGIDLTLVNNGVRAVDATVWPNVATLVKTLNVNNTAAANLPGGRQVNTQLTLTAGNLNLAAAAQVLTLANNLTVRVVAGTLTLAGGSVVYGTGMNYIYAVNAAYATGAELAPVASPINDLTFTRTANVINAATTLNKSIIVNGTLTIRNDVTTPVAPPTAVITANGNIVIANESATFSNATNPVITFNQSTVLGGNTNTTITVPSATPPVAIGAITVNKAANTNTVTITGGNLTTGTVTFVMGDIVTGNNILFIPAPTTGAVALGAISQGFTGAGPNSMVVGNLGKTLINTGGIGTSTEARSVFPVGTGVVYRPVAINFNPAFGVPTNPNTTIVSNHVDANPGGVQALPIKDGVAPGIDVSRYPAFYWYIYTTPGSVGPTTPFDLELTAGNFTDYDSPANVRIIRRHGAVGDINNDWLLQGSNTAYDNEVSSVTGFTAINRNANAGLRSGGAVFTLGVKSNMKVKTSIPKQWLVLSAGAKNYSLANLFEGNIGSLSYSAQSSNSSVATVAVSGSTLTVTPVTTGDANVTVKASDAANNDFFAYTFPVNVGLVSVEGDEIIPTEFSLSQNFPNPFNPTTNIKFGLPKESNVTLRIFNILGEEVATLVNKVMAAGFHTVNFDASRLTSGLYIYRIEADNFVQVKKMMLMK